MINKDVIIVGAGPAGSTCAWKLKQYGADCLILDKEEFPRLKLCAGWITPKVFSDLEIDSSDYPHSLMEFDRLYFHLFGLTIARKTRQYSIRRVEFDHWLVQRSGAPIEKHKVRNIRRENGLYIIDDQFACRHLVGAGGTHCPVYQTFFKEINPRQENSLIITLEEEFPYSFRDSRCHLWFFEHKLPGYSWYVPKGNGYLNVGIGGLFHELKKNNDNLQHHWQRLITKLEQRSLVTGHAFRPKGYVYYIRNNSVTPRIDNAFILGDAAGLATMDMGEGIGPAIESGLLAARAIALNEPYDLKAVHRTSNLMFPTLVRLVNIFRKN